MFGAFGARASKVKLSAIAIRALVREALLAFTMMASQRSLLKMHGHASIAVLALGHIAAVMAHEHQVINIVKLI